MEYNIIKSCWRPVKKTIFTISIWKVKTNAIAELPSTLSISIPLGRVLRIVFLRKHTTQTIRIYRGKKGGNHSLSIESIYLCYIYLCLLFRVILLTINPIFCSWLYTYDDFRNVQPRRTYERVWFLNRTRILYLYNDFHYSQFIIFVVLIRNYVIEHFHFHSVPV